MLRRFALVLLLVCPLLAEKRPLTQNDYDSWRHIQNQQLSNDGHFLAYALFPQEGDGELIVRNLVTGKEWRQPIGELPPPPPPNNANPTAEEAPTPPPGIAVKFSADSRTLVFSTFAPHAEVEQAKRAKRKPEDMPKGDLVIIDLTSGAVFRAPRIKSFQIPTKANGYVAYLQAPAPSEKSVNTKPSEPSAAESQTAETQPAATDEQPRPKKIETGDLTLRALSDGAERKFPDVTEYTLSKDAKALVYATASKKADSSGVYAVTPGDSAAPVALLSGKGKYSKLAWDEEQTRLAFVSDRDDAASRQPRFKLYDWDRRAAAATELVSSETPGFKPGWIISDKANITFSKDGDRIFFGAAPKPPAPKPPDPTPADERVQVDLWSWKDDYIQPMQKVRASMERSRSYRAVYDLNTKKFVQLADPTMYDLAPAEDGAYALGSDDREYRRMQEYDERYEDTYIVDTATGSRKLIAKKHIGRLAWSPDSKYAVYYDGNDWISISVPEGQVTNLTAKLGVTFGREDYDSPGRPPSYGMAGWTKDGRYVLLYDRFDVWQAKPDGSSAINLTEGFGRQNRLAFRVVRYERDDPADRWIDPSKPLLLRAENEETYDSGFYRTSIGATTPPVKLVMAAKNFTPPIKARDAEVYLLAASTFSEYPDLLITDGAFREFRKVSDANPQLAHTLWGTSELIHFRSGDGQTLKATLYKPENFDPNKKYPMLVYIYERLSQNVFNFVEPRPQHTINVSYYVSNGYLVLEPDIAYKIGYPGQSALNCVLPAIQEVVDRGFVNEKAIGIQGHSWGGYQIAYMITRTNRFRAAAAGAPVADMISAYDGIRWGPGIPRQFQYERTQSRIGGTIWEYPLRYIENSPIFMADRVSTPLLMIQNDADDAVPWYQGIEYFLALRRLNKEVYMFTYNGEPHGLRRRADQKDYAMRLQQFFDYHLKGAPKPAWMEHGIPYLEKPGVVIADSSERP
jgi:dipeptidyl aminopeptidase/acylaminoacyl peptidase